jgi:hypothetical protein
MKFRIVLGALVMLAVAGGQVQAAGVDAAPYGYPFTDPFKATVLGTPKIYLADLPKRVPKQELWLTIFPDRKTPELFWYDEKLNVSVVRQRQKAPLIFNIAGTGAGHNSQLMQVMERAFYKGGFHVISLPSPTHPNFIVSASETQVVGPLMSDSRDLYRAMQVAYAEVADSIEVSEFYVTGYSLGGAEAAFVSYIDETEGVFDFKKVLMINPPVNLYNSVGILDHMIEDIPGGPENFGAFFENLMRRFADVFKRDDFLDFSDDFLFKVYQDGGATDEGLRAMIGVSFRLSSSGMLFTSDVLSRSGVVVRRNASLSSTDRLTDYFKVSTRVSFVEYIEHLVHPFLQREDPGLTLAQLIDENSLKFLDDYLRTTDKIGVMGNADDIILAPGEFAYLDEVFAGRSKLYPIGGHCGNLPYKQNVADMIAFFKEGWGQ